MKDKLSATLKLWQLALDDLEGMKDLLPIEKINNQYFRRLIVRNLFSVIECFLSVSRELILVKAVYDKNNQLLSWEELAILNMESIFLDSDGKLKKRENIQSFVPLLKFTLTLMGKAFNEQIPNFGDQNFQKLVALYKRRNAITHPKCAGDESLK